MTKKNKNNMHDMNMPEFIEAVLALNTNNSALGAFMGFMSFVMSQCPRLGKWTPRESVSLNDTLICEACAAILLNIQYVPDQVVTKMRMWQYLSKINYFGLRGVGIIPDSRIPAFRELLVHIANNDPGYGMGEQLKGLS